MALKVGYIPSSLSIFRGWFQDPPYPNPQMLKSQIKKKFIVFVCKLHTSPVCFKSYLDY